MVKIGVLSDTHMRRPDPILDYILDTLFAETDMILHAGDVVSGRVLDRLELRGVLAVCGNMDDYEVAGSLPQTRIIEAAGKRIGLIHGWGAKEGLERRLLQRFEDPKPDVIIYGHSHVPFWGRVRGVAMFNPGSASTGSYRSSGSVGLIEIVGDKIEARHIPLKR